MLPNREDVVAEVRDPQRAQLFVLRLRLVWEGSNEGAAGDAGCIAHWPALVLEAVDEGVEQRRDVPAERLALLLIDRPGNSGRGDSAPDPLTVHGWDLIAFLLSLAESLGMIRREGDVLRAVDDSHDYFLLPLAERIPMVTRALEHQRAWSELDAAAWFQSGEPPVTGEGDGGFLAEDAGKRREGECARAGCPWRGKDLRIRRAGGRRRR